MQGLVNEWEGQGFTKIFTILSEHGKWCLFLAEGCYLLYKAIFALPKSHVNKRFGMVQICCGKRSLVSSYVNWTGKRDNSGHVPTTVNKKGIIQPIVVLIFQSR